jgi:hypothetical protein
MLRPIHHYVQGLICWVSNDQLPNNFCHHQNIVEARLERTKPFSQTIKCASWMSRIPSEQGRYHDFYQVFANAVRSGASLHVNAVEGVRTLAALRSAARLRFSSQKSSFEG